MVVVIYPSNLFGLPYLSLIALSRDGTSGQVIEIACRVMTLI